MQSCDSWFPSKVYAEDIVATEVATIDWDKLDQIPLWDSCDETASSNDQEACFTQGLRDTIASRIATLKLVTRDDLKGRIHLEFVIDTSGRMTLTPFGQPASIADLKSYIPPAYLESSPGLDTLITQQLKNLPQLYPATKKGIPVRTKILLPLAPKTSN